MNPMDRIERQFAQVFPVKPTIRPVQDFGTSLVEDVPPEPKDRLAELQSQLHIKGEQV